tara:strand:+ start:39 stop:419 length:381 start_codon:yes stop_codon:yes gene_type:complete
MSRPVIRVTDFHLGHFCLGTGTGFHATPFIVGNTSVLVNGKPTCIMGSVTACGDVAIGGNTSVLVGGVPILRTGDPTSGHPCTEAIVTTSVVEGAGTVTTTDLTCKLDGGYFHPTFAGMGSLNVLA